MQKFWELLEIILYETMSKIEDMHRYVIRKITDLYD